MLPDLAFRITAAFEGSGYASFQTYDSGLVSYGRFQFTLASGSLYSVLNRYVIDLNPASPLRAYLPRVLAQDPALRTDKDFKRCLLEASGDPIMHLAQNGIAYSRYYQPVMLKSVQPRKLELPLSIALAFDMAINQGGNHQRFVEVENAMGLKYKVPPVEQGVSELDFIKAVAQRNCEFLTHLGSVRHYPGLITRGQFWVSILDNPQLHLPLTLKPRLILS